jgi:hypothetical protein
MGSELSILTIAVDAAASQGPTAYVNHSFDANVLDFSFSLKNNLLFVCLSDGNVRILNVENGTVIKEFKPYSDGKPIRILNFKNLQKGETKKTKPELPQNGDFSLKDIFITLSSNFVIKVWDLGEWDPNLTTYHMLQDIYMTDLSDAGISGLNPRVISFDETMNFLLVGRQFGEETQILGLHINSFFYRYSEDFHKTKRHKKFFDYVQDFAIYGCNSDNVLDFSIINLDFHEVDSYFRDTLVEFIDIDPPDQEVCTADTYLYYFLNIDGCIKVWNIAADKLYPYISIEDKESLKASNALGNLELKKTKSDRTDNKIERTISQEKPGALPAIFQQLINEQKSQNSGPPGLAPLKIPSMLSAPPGLEVHSQPETSATITIDKQSVHPHPKKQKVFLDSNAKDMEAEDESEKPKENTTSPLRRSNTDKDIAGELKIFKQEQQETIVHTRNRSMPKELPVPITKDKDSPQKKKRKKNKGSKRGSILSTHDQLGFSSGPNSAAGPQIIGLIPMPPGMAQQINERFSPQLKEKQNSGEMSDSNQLTNTIEAKFNALMNSCMTQLDRKFEKIEEMIDNKIAEKLTKLQMSNVSETINNELDVKIHNQFTQCFEKTVTPCFEKYLVKMFEQISHTFEKGQKYYIDKLNIDQQASNQIKENAKEVVQTYMQISKALTESIVKNQENYVKLEQIFQDKKAHMVRLVDQMNEILQKQQDLQNSLENSEKDIFSTLAQLKSEFTNSKMLMDKVIEADRKNSSENHQGHKLGMLETIDKSPDDEKRLLSHLMPESHQSLNFNPSTPLQKLEEAQGYHNVGTHPLLNMLAGQYPNHTQQRNQVPLYPTYQQNSAKPSGPNTPRQRLSLNSLLSQPNYDPRSSGSGGVSGVSPDQVNELLALKHKLDEMFDPQSGQTAMPNQMSQSVNLQSQKRGLDNLNQGYPTNIPQYQNNGGYNQIPYGSYSNIYPPPSQQGNMMTQSLYGNYDNVFKKDS